MKVYCCLFLLFSLFLSDSSSSIVRKIVKLFDKQVDYCILKPNGDFASKNTPLISPYPEKIEDGGFKLEKDEVITMVCPGRDNKIEGYDEQKIHFTCVNGTDLKTDKSEKIDSINIRCIRPVEYVIKNVGPCVSDKYEERKTVKGDLAHIGFEVDGEHTTLYKACYNKTEMVTYWTTHVIKGALIKRRASVLKDDEYDVGNIMFPVSDSNDVMKAYSTQQPIAYKNGPNLLSGAVPDVNDCKLELFQLTTSRDLIMASEHRSTKLLVNNVPVMNVNVPDTIRKLEEKIRKLADKRKVDINVTTGTTIGGKRKIQLYINGVPTRVPWQIWKKVEIPSTGECMMFTIINFPREGLNYDACLTYKWGYIGGIRCERIETAGCTEALTYD